MHQCLCVSEILEAIFYFVFHGKRRYRLCSHLSLPDLIPSAETRDRRSIFRLALTCRAFRDLALNVLYSHLRNFWPLILPSRPSRLHHTPELFRPLVLASRIQILSQPFQDDTAYPSFFACAQKQAPLFPNLHSLAWRDCSLTCIPVLKHLLPTVEILSLDLSSSFRKAIIPALPTSAPRLKALEIKGSLFMTDKNPSEIESLLISYPDGLTELSLTCHWHDVPSAVLNVIAPWPSLRYLTLKLGLESIPTTPLHIVPQPFPALTDLHISSDDTLDLLISFLHTFRILKFDSSLIAFPNLKTIHFNGEGCSTANTWSQFLTSLAHTNTYLEHIIITEKYVYECLPPSSFDFRLLLAHPSLARLSTLFLSPCRTTTITLTDADILTLARTCPHLHSLGLGSRNTPVSLHALNILVRRCCELREVSLCVDARFDTLRDSEHADDEDEVGLQPNTCLINLEVGSSPTASVGSLRSSPELTESIPRFLHAMAPSLKSITVMYRAWSHETSEDPWQVVSYAF
ncbi:hypothetical protein CY34DRAFT_805708 [Suillus luteus UH-Slu-Lm8-n1]|uniref:F-box domain-containing protein n=1 Tax=Suillus luteus UH-Slu-Lm8-n1 TaxID=930992 RepID=A0A0D0AV22_9AGAM|nr:hypothetical protein CY34DRAFT_805708 [Suillus luteus UH-Slu-Lm8-n1]